MSTVDRIFCNSSKQCNDELACHYAIRPEHEQELKERKRKPRFTDVRPMCFKKKGTKQ